MSRYDAFISYRHCRPDKDVAMYLQRSLESYRVPKLLCKQGVPKRLSRVFRDEDELVAGELPPRILEALEQSRYLIVVCSPRTPSSKWVSAEVECFQRLGRPDMILPVLVDGEPEDSFPPSIQNCEILAADIRPPAQWRARLKSEKLRILARLLGCDFDELFRRHRTRFIKQCTAVAFVTCMVLGVVTCLSVQNLHLTEEIQVATARADSLRDQIDNVQAQLQTRISNQQKRLVAVSEAAGHTVQIAQTAQTAELKQLSDRLSVLLDQFQDDVGIEGLSHEDDSRVRLAQATIANANQDYGLALKFVTEEVVRRRKGAYVEALKTQASAFHGLREWHKALERYQQILALRSNDFSTQNLVAICYVKLGQLKESLAIYDKIVQLLSSLVEKESRSAFLVDDLAMIHNNRGNALRVQGNLGAAIADFDTAIKLQNRLIQAEGHNQLVSDLMMSHNNRGIALRLQGRLHEAINDYDKVVTYLTRLVEEEGRSELAADLAGGHNNRGNAFRDQGRLGNAIADFGKAIRIQRRLVEVEGRSELADDLAMSHSNRGIALKEQGKLDHAIADFDKAVNIRTRLVEIKGRTELVHYLAVSHNNRGNVLLSQGKLDAAVSDIGKAVGIYTQLVEAEGRNELENDLAMSHNNRGNALRDQRRFRDAIMDFDRAVKIRTRLVEVEGRHELANDLAMAHTNRGNALRDQGKFRDAIMDFDKAVEIRTRLVEVEGRKELANDLATTHSNRGNAFRDQKKQHLAMSDYEKAIEIQTLLVEVEGRTELANDLATSHNNRGIIYHEQGNFEEAVRDCDRAINIYIRLMNVEGRNELAATLATSLYNRGTIHREQGNFEEAVRDCEEAINIYIRLVAEEGRNELANDLADNFNSQAWFYLTCPDGAFRDVDQALQYATEANEIALRMNWNYLHTLAAAFAAAGDFEAAVKCEKEAIEIAPPRHKLRLSLKLFEYKARGAASVVRAK